MCASLAELIHADVWQPPEEVQLVEQVFHPVATNSSTAPKRKQQDTQLKAAWVDDDDGSIEVSLEDQKRLRKLRKTEEDTQVDGHELQQRLKKQYGRLCGSPLMASRYRS